MTHSERDQEIIERYTEGATALVLSRAFGLSEPRIRQIVAGVKKQKRSRQNSAISDAHRRLGRKVYDYRFDNQLTRSSVAAKLGWSTSKLRSVEDGLVDPTLMDLQDLATFMKRNLGELINDVFGRH